MICYLHQITHYLKKHTGFEAKTSVLKIMKNVLHTYIFAPVLQLISESCSYRALCPKNSFQVNCKNWLALWGLTINDVMPKLAIFDPLPSPCHLFFGTWV